MCIDFVSNDYKYSGVKMEQKCGPLYVQQFFAISYL